MELNDLIGIIFNMVVIVILFVIMILQGRANKNVKELRSYVLMNMELGVKVAEKVDEQRIPQVEEAQAAPEDLADLLPLPLYFDEFAIFSVVATAEPEDPPTPKPKKKRSHHKKKEPKEGTGGNE